MSSGVGTSFIEVTDASNSQPQKRRKRGRPSNRKNTEGVTESSIELSVNTNASDNSAAVVKQGICSTPVMRISPGRRRLSTSSVGSTGTMSNHTTPRKSISKKSNATPKELGTINEFKPNDGNTQLSLNKAHLELATITHGNNITEARTYKFSASPLSSISSQSTNSSPYVDASSSPLKTSPVSVVNVSASLKHLSSVSSTIYMKKDQYHSLETQEDHASVDQLLLQSSPVLMNQQLEHTEKESSSSHGDSPNSLQISASTVPKTPTSKNTNTFLSPNKFSSLETAKLQPPSTPTSNFSSIMNSSPMYTLWYQQTPKAVAPPVATKSSNKKKRQLVTMSATPAANLVPMPVGIEDIVSTPRGGLRIVEKKEGETELEKEEEVSQDVKQKADKLDSIVAKIHEKFPKSITNDSSADKKVVSNTSDTSSAQTTPSPQNPKRLKKQSSRVNLLNHYRQQNAEISSSPSTASVSPTLSQGLSSALLPSNYEISVKITADGKAKIVTQRRKRPAGLQTPQAYHLMNGFSTCSNIPPSTPIMKQSQIQQQLQAHSPYYHYHPAFPCHMEVKQSPQTPVGLGVTNHVEHGLVGLNGNIMMAGMDMHIANNTGLGLIKAANNVPGIKIGAGTDPFVTGISSNFNEFENPILIAQSPSTPFVNQYGQHARGQFMGHNFVINTPGTGGGIGVLGSPKDTRYELLEKRNADHDHRESHDENNLNDYDDIRRDSEGRLTKGADQQHQNFKCDARFALQALLEEI